MCRIAGIISLRQPLESLQQQVRQLCNLQEHGGPDGEGFYSCPDKGLVFGHRRLSLIDLTAGGQQPMLYGHEHLVITYNGELYNYRPLKKDLQALGYQFASNSDTEVILAAFAAWGTSAFKRFAGMFAFALLDLRENAVYLVRDPLGIKPLYYSHRHDELHFASEVRALASLSETATEDPHWPVYFLAYGHLPEPITTLQSVKPLPKGCYLRYSLFSQRTDIHTYQHFSYLENLGNKAEVLERVRQCLRTAVERHLLSDAPIGAFLSGGIDSSLMALLAGEVIPDNLTTLSLYFNEQHYSEKPFQELIARQLRGRHHAFCLGQNDFEAAFPRIMAAMDLPSNDGINTWFISKYAREAGLKAVLSGLGGDELFGGYPSFDRMKAAHYLQQLPASTLKAGRYSGSKKFKRLAYLSLPGIKGKYLFLRGQFIPQEIARQLDLPEEQVWRLLQEQPLLPDVHHMTHPNQASWMEMNLYMQNQLLRDSDVMSMAHGIEIRVPFLDPDFVKLVLQIRSDLKYEGGGKRLLVEAFSDLLPRQIYDRPKMGFSFPFKEWLGENEWAREELRHAGKESQRLYLDFTKGHRHWSQVLSLLLIQTRHATAKAAPSYA
ncbi:MAG: asparagine synthase (glutamine-hydrolyzing) [Chitinophagaceae bacterium]|nr:MAG: asparagine synthase (glutamine-hydrolyzing) [Chitinophagaceae bacterium]